MDTLPAPFVPSSPSKEVLLWIILPTISYMYIADEIERIFLTQLCPQTAKEEAKGITRRLAELECATPSTKRVSHA